MNWLRKHPGFAAAWLILGLVGLGEAACLRVQVKAARAAAKSAEQVRRELQALASRTPAPTAETARLIAADLERADEIQADLREALADGEWAAERHAGVVVPLRRAEAYFDLATFVEAMRRRARQSGVSVRAEECFGFAVYAHEAPEIGRVAAVMRERAQVQFLLEALLDAQPVELLAVRRERPSSEVARPGAAGARLATPAGTLVGSAQDYFEMDRTLTLRTPGVIGATAYQLTFSGRTDALRSLLNRLEDGEQPSVVRLVEASPADRRVEPARRQDEQAPQSLVLPALTRFCVTVEFITLPPASPAA